MALMGSGNPRSFFLALGAGAAKGLAHVGVLKVLQEEGLRPRRVAGTSIGALVGALYCLDPDPARLERLALQFESIPLHTILAPRLSASGLVDDRRVRDFLESFFGSARIEKLALPFACVAVDIRSGRPVWMEKGPLLDAVMASISVPVVFPAQRHGRRFLVDGGLVDPVPVDVLRQKGVAPVVAVSLFAPGRGKRPGPGRPRPGDGGKVPWERRLIAGAERLLGRLEKRPAGPHLVASLLAALEIMQKEVVRARLQADRPDLLVDVDTAGFSLHEFYRPRELIARGEEAARRALPGLLRLLSPPR